MPSMRRTLLRKREVMAFQVVILLILFLSLFFLYATRPPRCKNCNNTRRIYIWNEPDTYKVWPCPECSS